MKLFERERPPFTTKPDPGRLFWFGAAPGISSAKPVDVFWPGNSRIRRASTPFEICALVASISGASSVTVITSLVPPGFNIVSTARSTFESTWIGPRITFSNPFEVISI